MQNNSYTDTKEIKPTCGNGIDEEVFEHVVSSLNNQNCDERGPDYMLYDDGDYRQLARDPFNKVRYQMIEGFGNSSSNIWCYWLLVIVFLVLLYFVLFA